MWWIATSLGTGIGKLIYDIFNKNPAVSSLPEFPKPTNPPIRLPGPLEKELFETRIKEIDNHKQNHKSIKNKVLKEGDVVWVQRIGYKHFGIYVGEDNIIHYTSTDNRENTIMQTNMSFFLQKKTHWFVIDFDELTNISNWSVFSAEETVKRAKSRLGEDKYNLVVNNCEHFAFWCKTGISESDQINELLYISCKSYSIASKIKKIEIPKVLENAIN